MFVFTAIGPRLDEFLAESCTAGGGARRGEPAQRRRDARLDDRDCSEATDPANHELNMVFTFSEHVSLDSRPGGSGKFDLAPLSLPVLKKNLNEWQVALAEVGWNSLYWDNHDQPRAVSRFGDEWR